MTIFQAVILGIVQGFSEFLPISSSAHLVLVPAMFSWQIPVDQIFPFDVLVQLGTLVAVIIYFWKDLWSMAKAFLTGLVQRKPFETTESRLAWWLILATIPAGIIGLFLDDVVEKAFNTPLVPMICLLITAALMWLAESLSKHERVSDDMKWLDALLIGLGQALAIFPGISRSGATISTAMLRNFDRKHAGRFSFLMSIPIMLAAGLLGVKDLLEVQNLMSFLPSMVIGFIMAGVVGYLSIAWLLKFLRERSLKLFSYYCVGFAVLSAVVIYVV
jgi:undecaprenyl-diphosphatase